MRDKTARMAILILKKWMQGMVELLAFLPVILILGICLLPRDALLLWLVMLPIYYLAGLLAGRVVGEKHRIIQILLVIAASGISIWFLFELKLYAAVPFISGILLLDRGLRFSGCRWRDLFPISCLWIGMILYFFAYFFFVHLESLDDFAPLVGWAGLGYMVVSLFIINSEQLKAATLPGDKEPVISPAILKHNWALIIVSLVVITIIALFDQLKDGVVWLARGAVYLFFQFLLFISNLFVSTSQGPMGGGGSNIMEMLPEVEERGPSVFDSIVEVVGTILSVAAGLLLVIALARVLFKVFKKLFEILTKVFKGGTGFEYEGGYVDEKESLIDIKDLGRNYADRLKDWLSALMEREPKWEDLKDNRERVRYIYRYFLIRCMAAGYRLKKHLTPKEIVRDLSRWDSRQTKDADQLIGLYNCARYGNSPIEDEKVKNLAGAFGIKSSPFVKNKDRKDY